MLSASGTSSEPGADTFVNQASEDSASIPLLNGLDDGQPEVVVEKDSSNPSSRDVWEGKPLPIPNSRVGEAELGDGGMAIAAAAAAATRGLQQQEQQREEGKDSERGKSSGEVEEVEMEEVAVVFRAN